MFVVAKLLRAKLERDSKGGPSLREEIAQNAARAQEESAQVKKPCWLCGLDASSQYQLVESFPLCHSCFQVSYAAFILPALKENNQFGMQLFERLQQSVKEERCQSSEERALHVQSYRSVKKASRSEGQPWDCPSCTFINKSRDTNCAVCNTVSPKVVTCVHCKQPCASEAGLSVCPATKRQHEVWECDRCTVINTIAADTCPVCAADRRWNCDACGASNRCRPGKRGEKFCSSCGTMAMTASVRRLFLEEQEKQREVVEKMEREKDRLFARLQKMDVGRRFQLSDGNCQFRALSHQLLGSPDHHMLVRHVIVEHIMHNVTHYLQYFESRAEFMQYMERMRRSATWGDELTLKACAEVFDVHVHVISSEEHNWHIHYKPPTESQFASRTTTLPASGVADVAEWPEESPHVFVAYLNGVHYDDITRPPPLPAIGTSLVGALSKARATEEEWDEAIDPYDGRSVKVACCDAHGVVAGSSVLSCREPTDSDWVEVEKTT